MKLHPDAAIAVKYANKIQSCKTRDIDMLLSFSEYAALQSKTHCELTGVAFAPQGKHRLTIDRLDPDKPYVASNCLAVTKAANHAKAKIFEDRHQSMSIGSVIIMCHRLLWLKFKPR